LPHPFPKLVATRIADTGCHLLASRLWFSSTYIGEISGKTWITLKGAVISYDFLKSNKPRIEMGYTENDT
jgi:hypothetical protein